MYFLKNILYNVKEKVYPTPVFLNYAYNFGVFVLASFWSQFLSWVTVVYLDGNLFIGLEWLYSRLCYLMNRLITVIYFYVLALIFLYFVLLHQKDSSNSGGIRCFSTLLLSMLGLNDRPNLDPDQDDYLIIKDFLKFFIFLIFPPVFYFFLPGDFITETTFVVLYIFYIFVLLVIITYKIIVISWNHMTIILLLCLLQLFFFVTPFSLAIYAIIMSSLGLLMFFGEYSSLVKKTRTKFLILLLVFIDKIFPSVISTILSHNRFVFDYLSYDKTFLLTKLVFSGSICYVVTTKYAVQYMIALPNHIEFPFFNNLMLATLFIGMFPVTFRLFTGLSMFLQSVINQIGSETTNEETKNSKNVTNNYSLFSTHRHFHFTPKNGINWIRIGGVIGICSLGVACVGTYYAYHSYHTTTRQNALIENQTSAIEKQTSAIEAQTAELAKQNAAEQQANDLQKLKMGIITEEEFKRKYP